MRIFLSYRREDSSPWAGRLNDGLAAEFGKRNIFQDVVAVGPGEDFIAAIERALGGADTTLAVIGPAWLTVTGPSGGRRLDEPDDYVVAELRAALVRGGCTGDSGSGRRCGEPRPADLSTGLEALVQRQAVTLRDNAWRQDVDALIRALRGDEPGTSRRHWPIAAGVGAMVALACVVALVVIIKSDDDNSASQTSAAGTSVTDGSVTTISRCPASTGWGLLELAPDPSGDIELPNGTVHVTARQMATQATDDRWLVLVDVALQNNTAAVISVGEWYVQQLEVASRPFSVRCFNGRTSLAVGRTADAVVGFEVSCEPAGRINLVAGERRDVPIQLTPDPEPRSC
jgi:hypothetical protein